MNKLNRYYISQNISIDNALSMNQILHQIVNEIKGIVEFINNLELRANEYTDEQIRLLNERLQAQLETLEDTLKTYTNDKIDEYNAEIINPQLIEIRNTIDTINRTINERIDREVGILNRHINSVESTLNKKIDDTKEYLEELIKKGNQLVYSSISGKKIPIQDTLFEMGNALKQILSYNWNTIDKLKTFSNERISGDDVIRLKNGLDSSTDTDIYFYKYELSSLIPTYYQFTLFHQGIEYFYQTWSFEWSSEVKLNGVIYSKPQNFNTGFIIPTSELKFYNEIEFSYKPYDNDNIYKCKIIIYDYSKTIPKITFNSLKAQMQNTDIEIRPNWNGLVFDGVNGWNILANTSGLYNDETFINPLWNEIPYKNNVYRNENSSFYNQIENQENGGN